MKTLLAVVLALGLAACAAAPVSDVMKLPDAPSLPPAVKLPEVLDQLPSGSYVRLADVDAKGVIGMSPTQLRARVLEQAQKLGADAVVLQDASTRTPAESKYNPATGGYDVRPGEVIPGFKGVAIKYRS
jgi:hypothetical protein